MVKQFLSSQIKKQKNPNTTPPPSVKKVQTVKKKINQFINC